MVYFQFLKTDTGRVKCCTVSNANSDLDSYKNTSQLSSLLPTMTFFFIKKGRRQVHWQTSLFYLSIKYMTQTLADPNFKPPFHLLLNPALNEYA